MELMELEGGQKFASLAFFPFGKEVVYGGGAVSLIANIIWLIVSGISHIFPFLIAPSTLPSVHKTPILLVEIFHTFESSVAVKYSIIESSIITILYSIIGIIAIRNIVCFFL